MFFIVYYGAVRVLFTISTILFSHFVLFLINLSLKDTPTGTQTEFCVLVVTIIFCVTIADRFIHVVFIAMIIFVGIALASIRKENILVNNLTFFYNRPNCITFCRSAVYLITSICISAADFNIFPPHLLKSRDYGCGLMDTGIGLFIVSMAILPENQIKATASCRKIKNLLKGITPLILLGVGRTAILNFINYNQDVTEYGLHWNAFFTIAVTKLLGGIIHVFFPNKLAIVSIILIILHETALQFGLASWIMNLELGRDTWITANREGIFSILGFLFIYLTSSLFGLALNNETTITQKEFISKRKTLQDFTLKFILIFLVIAPLTNVSRRVANTAYCLWVLSLSGIILSIFMHLEEFASKCLQMKEGKNYTLPVITEAVNKYAMLFFLVSNVLTGAINIFLNPKGRSEIAALGILLSYMAFLCSMVVYLYKNKVKIF